MKTSISNFESLQFLFVTSKLKKINKGFLFVTFLFILSFFLLSCNDGHEGKFTSKYIVINPHNPILKNMVIITMEVKGQEISLCEKWVPLSENQSVIDKNNQQYVVSKNREKIASVYFDDKRPFSLEYKGFLDKEFDIDTPSIKCKLKCENESGRDLIFYAYMNSYKQADLYANTMDTLLQELNSYDYKDPNFDNKLYWWDLKAQCFWWLWNFSANCDSLKLTARFNNENDTWTIENGTLGNDKLYEPAKEFYNPYNQNSQRRQRFTATKAYRKFELTKVIVKK